MENIKGVIENDITYDLLVSKISEVAREKIEADAQKARTRIAILATAGLTILIAALTGVASLALQATERSIVQSAKEELSNAVARETKAAVDGIKSQISTEITAAVDREAQAAELGWRQNTLLTQIDRLASGPSFSNSDMDEAIELLSELSRDQKFRQSERFKTSLADLVSTATAVENKSFIQALKAEFEKEMIDNPDVSARMAIMMGRQLITSNFAPDNGEIISYAPEWTALVVEYRKWSTSAELQGFPEIPVTYDLILSCMESRAPNIRSAYLSRVDSLNTTDFEAAIAMAQELSTQDWRMEPDSETLKAKERINNCAKSLVTADLSDRSRTLLVAMGNEALLEISSP